MVNWEYMLHAARQLWILVALECFAKTRHEDHSQFPPPQTHLKLTFRACFSFSIMEKSLHFSKGFFSELFCTME